MTDVDSLAGLLEASPALAAALPGAERAARSGAPILLLGEAGTGRSTLARAFHRASGRSAGPLVELDAGVVPTTLFESELFGHRPGAFTGAESAVEGRVKRADGGTMVLDHVEELPLAIQPKLLRLLADGVYAPLGGREERADVRWISLAEEALPERVARGAFREDLFYRLEVLAFRIPPLRERREDIPRLAAAVLAELGRRFERPALRLAETASAWIAEYDWPGNLREMRNVFERTIILAESEVLDPDPPRGAAATRPPSLVEVEREALRRALAFARGHQGRAAEILGISRKALWEKRHRHGLP